MVKSRIYGYSLHLNLTNCAHSEIFRKHPEDNDNGAKCLKIFIDSLIEKIKMKAVYEPIVKYYGQTPELEGYSYVQLIDCSSITLHSVSSTSDIYLDVFSCRSYDTEQVIEYAKQYFKPGTCDYDYIIR